MPRFWHRKAWRIGRVCFRWVRIVCWLLLLALVGALVYLNQVGLPEVITRRVEAELQARGVDLRYEQMRLDFTGAVVVERILFGRPEDPDEPSLFLERAVVGFNPAQMRRLRFQVESLTLQRGRLRVPVNLSNQPPARLQVEGLGGHVEFLPGDEWRLRQFTARMLGAELRLSGVLSKASAIQHWPLFGGTRRGTGAWRRHVREVLDYAGRTVLSRPPIVTGAFRVDAADPKNSLARLNLRAEGLTAPHGEAQSLRLEVQLTPAPPGEELPAVSLDLRVSGAHTPWGEASELEWHTATRPLSQPGGWPAAGATLTAVAPRTRWGEAARLQLTVSSVEVRSDDAGFAGEVELSASDVRSEWGGAGELWVSARGAELPRAEVQATGPDWGPWAQLAPYDLRWRLRAAEVTTPRLDAQRVSGSGHWHAPQLTVDWLDAVLPQGTLSVSGRLDVETRAATWRANTELDPKKLTRLLGEKTLRWFDQFGWDRPPQVGVRGGLTLPAWTNRVPDWEADLEPTLWLEGALTNGPGHYRGVPFLSASGPFRFTNQTWHLPALVITRPEGVLHLEHVSNERTRDYSFHVRGALDPQALRPVLGPGAHRALDLFRFSGPPEFEGEWLGRWRELGRTAVRARLRATNFTFRGEQVDAFSGALAYTNDAVHFRDVRLVRPEGEGTVAAGQLAIPDRLVHLTNVVGRVDPMSIARMIGPKTAESLQPYQFFAPPQITLDGSVHLEDESRNDLRFHLQGGPFRWSRFHLPQMRADLHWVNDGLSITNFEGAFYDGKIRGGAHFDFRQPPGALFGFAIEVWEADLKKLLADITARSNQVEGVLNGRLTVTRAHTADWTSWQGGGEVSMRDGLLWDVPLFGFLSGPLNTLLPGIGQSRAEAAQATYTITNSIITTDDLKIEAGTVLLKYRGTVDFDTRVNARVEAEVLRDTGFFGRLVNLALWPVAKLLEYRVTGTIAAPVPEPLYFLPRVLLSPLTPGRPAREPAPTAPPAPPVEPPAVPPPPPRP
jgi:hypothetical protein